MKFLIVLTGAGASFDCHIPEVSSNKRKLGLRPPLTQDLFSNRYQVVQKNFNYISGVIATARKNQKNDSKDFRIERFLKQLQESGKQGFIKAQHLKFYLQNLTWYVANYYLESGMDSVSAYHNLIEETTYSNFYDVTVFINMNYDPLMDISLRDNLNGVFKNPEGYSWNNQKYLYIKPHGSYNWKYYLGNLQHLKIPKYENSDVLTSFIEKISNYESLLSIDKIKVDENVKTEKDFLVKNNFHHNSKGLLEIAKIPAIVAPIEGKYGFVMPSIHFQYLEMINKPDVIDLVSVGYSFKDNDVNSILKNISSKIKNILIIDTDDSKLFKNRVDNLFKSPNKMFFNKGLSKVNNEITLFIKNANK